MLDATTQGHKNNRLLAGLPIETFDAMAPNLRQVSIAQGAVIFEPGEDIVDVYFPQTGMISLLVIPKSGAPIETSTVGREGAFGLHRGLGARRSFTRAAAQIGGRFSTIAANRFEQLVQMHSPLRDLIERYTELLLAEAQQISACNAAHDAPSRLARWLLQCADRTGSERLALTQEYLAQMLSVRRTTVTLLAQALQRKGRIKYSRGQITILDRPGLSACACDCYPTIQQDKLAHLIGVKI